MWLDLPRRTVMRQVTLRTLRRIVHRDELWNGNRERIRTVFAWDPHESIIRWAWTDHSKYVRRVRGRQASAWRADRVVIAAAGDDRGAVAAVMQLIDQLGFDAVDAGPLEAGLALEPDGAVFGLPYSADELSNLLWPEASSA